MSTYSWSIDLTNTWETLKDCLNGKHTIRIKSNGLWMVISPKTAEYKIIPTSTPYLVDVAFHVETVSGIKHIIILREDVTQHTIEKQIEFIHTVNDVDYSSKCVCGLDSSGLAGIHSYWCTFAGVQTIGTIEIERQKKRKENKEK